MKTFDTLPPLPEITIVRRKTITSTPISQPERGKLITVCGEDFLTSRQAARVVSVQPETIARWVRNGQLPAFKVGRKLLIKKSDLLTLVEGHAVQPKAS